MSYAVARASRPASSTAGPTGVAVSLQGDAVCCCKLALVVHQGVVSAHVIDSADTCVVHVNTTPNNLPQVHLYVPSIALWHSTACRITAAPLLFLQGWRQRPHRQQRSAFSICWLHRPVELGRQYGQELASTGRSMWPLRRSSGSTDRSAQWWR